MNRTQTVFLLLFGTVLGCGKKQPADQGEGNSREDKVTMIADDDPRMNAAMEEARATVRTFINALRTPQKNQVAFSVKMAFADGPHTEHMWLSAVSYDGKSFHGRVNNDPQKVTTVKIGQQVTVVPSKISDWMFVQDRKLVGGYTIRVLRDAMPAEERAKFDKDVPFTID